MTSIVPASSPTLNGKRPGSVILRYGLPPSGTGQVHDKSSESMVTVNGSPVVRAIWT